MELGFPAKMFARAEFGLRQLVLLAQRQSNVLARSPERRPAQDQDRSSTRISELERELVALRHSKGCFRKIKGGFKRSRISPPLEFLEQTFAVTAPMPTNGVVK